MFYFRGVRMVGSGIVRLGLLLGGLGLGLYGAAVLYGRDNGAMRAGLIADSAAIAVPTRADSAPQSLPAAVLRLADSPLEGPSHPVVIGAAQPVVAPVAEVAPPEAAGAWRSVRVSSANVRGGPSTGYGVIGRVTLGEEVEVVDMANGWVHIRIQGDGVDGWVAERLLAP